VGFERGLSADPRETLSRTNGRRPSRLVDSHDESPSRGLTVASNGIEVDDGHFGLSSTLPAARRAATSSRTFCTPCLELSSWERWSRPRPTQAPRMTAGPAVLTLACMPERRDPDRITDSGIDVRRFYGPDDLDGFDPAAQLAEPGAFPFTRGIQQDMYRGRSGR